jgi:hypothetical protein
VLPANRVCTSHHAAETGSYRDMQTLSVSFRKSSQAFNFENPLCVSHDEHSVGPTVFSFSLYCLIVQNQNQKHLVPQLSDLDIIYHTAVYAASWIF